MEWIFYYYQYYQNFQFVKKILRDILLNRTPERAAPDAGLSIPLFIARVENAVRMRQKIGFVDRHSRVRGNPVFSRENGNPEN
jgi:hypothetical protein